MISRHPGQILADIIVEGKIGWSNGGIKSEILGEPAARRPE